MEANWKSDNVEEAFKELDTKEYNFFARSLASYRDSLVKEGFTREEAITLVEAYSKYIYDMSIEDFIRKNIESSYEDSEEDNDVDDGEEV